MFVAITAVVISGLFGIAIGLVAGYRRGLFDRLAEIVVDIQLAFPFVLLVILVVGVLGPGLENLALVLGATGWIQYARVVRVQTASLRSVAYVRAGEVLGLSATRIALVHVLPNCMSAIVVIASFAVAQMTLWEAALSFLGLGVQPPQVSWGMMLSGGRNYISSAPHLVIVPGLLIAALVLGMNLLGEWLRDVLDPSLQLSAMS
jgi:peptide/nickel transport system permease protein